MAFLNPYLCEMTSDVTKNGWKRCEKNQVSYENRHCCVDMKLHKLVHINHNISELCCCCCFYSHNNVLQVAQRNVSIVAHTQHRVRSYFFATGVTDDLLFMSQSREHLQCQLYLQHSYANRERYKVSETKTKTMHFNAKKSIRRELHF